jgi:acyl carrier protein
MDTMQSGSVPEPENLQDVIAELVASSLGKKRNSIGPEAPVFSSQEGFDSIGLMELVLRLEDTFGLSIPDEDLDPDIFYSVRTIASYVHSRLQGEN